MGRRVTEPKPVFTVRLRPLPQCSDPIKALRALLKLAFRRFGLRAVEVSETQSVDKEENQWSVLFNRFLLIKRPTPIASERGRHRRGAL